MNLLSSCTSGGCGAKIGPSELARALVDLPKSADPRLLVGFEGSDDAAVYQMDGEHSLVCTADFFPPMVEDPLTYGRIAAANALSDVYAMGGRPLLALNLLCFPQRGEWEALAQILQGGAQKAAEAGCPIAGGHSIYDHEVKYGLSVTGIVRTSKVIRNDTPRPGDRLILTKRLGTGIILSARRAGMAAEDAYQEALEVMQRLNRDAACAMDGYDVSAATDVTGFGLLGHLREMAGQSTTLAIDPDSLPLQPMALAYAQEYLTTAAGQRNRNALAEAVDVDGLARPMQEVLFDPQTSGGLLIAVANDEAEGLLALIRRTDPHAAMIGTVHKRGEKPVTIGGKIE